MPDASHPRLFFSQKGLDRLRQGKNQGLRAAMWKNITTSAKWCAGRPVRTQWIAPVEPDPIYANLYDRFYAMMHDMAVAEYLAFSFAYQQEEWMFESARKWLGTLCRVWIKEADGEPDASKAYAAIRLLKGVAVSYDLLAPHLRDEERDEARRTIVQIAKKYYAFFADRKNGFHKDSDYEPHHGSVEAGSFGVAALAVLGEERDATTWVDFFTATHTDWLLPHALTPVGTHNQTSNFWISITQYRVSFMDALRRVTGNDLFQRFKKEMGGDIALAAAAGSGTRDKEFGQTNESWLFSPSFGGIEYASPGLMYLAREYRRPIYQHLAAWDNHPGAIQKTRYVGPAGDMLLFNWGAYAYAWYDPTVPDAAEPGLPLSFTFLDTNKDPILEVNEAYARVSYEAGDLAVAMQRGAVAIHARGLPVLNDFIPTWPPLHPVKDVKLTDDGSEATISCAGVDDSIFTREAITLHRPDRVTLRREAMKNSRFWCGGKPTKHGDELRWPAGVVLRIKRGRLAAFDPRGFTEEKITGMGKLPLMDPYPTTYAVVEVEPVEGAIEIEIEKACRR